MFLYAGIYKICFAGSGSKGIAHPGHPAHPVNQCGVFIDKIYRKY
jgi:hypothetical protein